MNHYKSLLWSLIPDLVTLGREQTFVISSPKPFLSNSTAIHGWKRMKPAWLEQKFAVKRSLSWESHPRRTFIWPGLACQWALLAVTLKNKKNILKNRILKIKASSGQRQVVHLSRDPLSEKLLMEWLYLAAIQLANKCSSIHYNLKFSWNKAHFLRLWGRWDLMQSFFFPLRHFLLYFSFIAWS